MDEELVKKRAYEIYIRRTKCPIWDYGRKGTKDGDYFQALYEVRKEQREFNQSHNNGR